MVAGRQLTPPGSIGRGDVARREGPDRLVAWLAGDMTGGRTMSATVTIAVIAIVVVAVIAWREWGGSGPDV